MPSSLIPNVMCLHGTCCGPHIFICAILVSSANSVDNSTCSDTAVLPDTCKGECSMPFNPGFQALAYWVLKADALCNAPCVQRGKWRRALCCMCSLDMWATVTVARPAQGQGLKEMDMLVWLGDFNYRVDAEYAEAKGLVRRNDLSLLLSKVPQLTEILYLHSNSRP